MTQPFLHPNFFPDFFFIWALSSLQRHWEETHKNQIRTKLLFPGLILLKSDDEEICSNDLASQEMTDTTTAAAPPLDESSQEMTDTTKAAAPPLDSASQEIELPPLLSDPEASVPETDLIERDFNAMEAELTHKTAENHMQVTSFALIFKNEHAFFQH